MLAHARFDEPFQPLDVFDRTLIKRPTLPELRVRRNLQQGADEEGEYCPNERNCR